MEGALYGATSKPIRWALSSMCLGGRWAEMLREDGVRQIGGLSERKVAYLNPNLGMAGRFLNRARSLSSSLRSSTEGVDCGASTGVSSLCSSTR